METHPGGALQESIIYRAADGRLAGPSTSTTAMTTDGPPTPSPGTDSVSVLFPAPLILRFV